MSYSFEIHFKRFNRVSPTLQDVQSIKVSGRTIAAKNAKYGEFYFSPLITNLRGRFHHSAGSHNYPILFPKTAVVVMRVENFPFEPKIDGSDAPLFKEWISPFLTIENVQQT